MFPLKSSTNIPHPFVNSCLIGAWRLARELQCSSVENIQRSLVLLAGAMTPQYKCHIRWSVHNCMNDLWCEMYATQSYARNPKLFQFCPQMQTKVLKTNFISIKIISTRKSYWIKKKKKTKSKIARCTLNALSFFVYMYFEGTFECARVLKYAQRSTPTKYSVCFHFFIFGTDAVNNEHRCLKTMLEKWKNACVSRLWSLCLSRATRAVIDVVGAFVFVMQTRN